MQFKQIFESEPMRVGYIRVSTIEQNIARQLEGVDLDKVFIDKASGKNIDRPQFKEMMSFVREGDKVFVHSMDRLARNLMDLRSTVETLIKKKVEITFVQENLTFNGENNPVSNLMLSLMGSFGEFEYNLIRERQREGIQIARTKGVYKGRSKSLNPEQMQELKNMVCIEGMKKTFLAKKFGISRYTLYNYLKDNKESLKENIA